VNVFALMLAAYLAGIAAAALRGVRTARTPERFLVADRRCGGLLVGGSLTATIIGGSSTLGLAGLAFRQGLTGCWWLLVGIPGLAGLLLFVPALRAQPAYTLPQLIGRWYGPAMRRASAALVAASWLGIVGAQASAAGSILATFMGGRPRMWTLAAGGLFILYTAAGGQLSVMGTDLLQLALILAGIGSCLAAGLLRVGGLPGLGAALRAASGPPGAEALAFPFSGAFGPVDLALLLLVVGSTYLTGPDMLSRVFCARSDRAARGGILGAACLIAPFAPAMALIGLLARARRPTASCEAALPELGRTVLPAPLAALCMIALLSAFLSSADSTLLTLAAVINLDLLHRPDGPAPAVGELRLTVVGAGAAAVAVGALSGGVIPSLLLGYSVFSGGLFVPILAALAGRPMRPLPVMVACAAGGSLALAGRLAGSDALVAGAFALSALALAADRLSRRGGRAAEL